MNQNPYAAIQDAEDAQIRLLTCNIALILLYLAIFAIVVLAGRQRTMPELAPLLILLAVPVSLHAIALIGLTGNRIWGRYVSLCIAVLTLPAFPLGTALGIFMIVQASKPGWRLLAQGTPADQTVDEEEVSTPLSNDGPGMW